MARLIIDRPDTTGGHYVPVPNEWVRDSRLSFRARGILALLLAEADDRDVSVAHLVTRTAEGKAAIESALKELEHLGYLVREQKRGPDGRHNAGTWTLSAPPTDGRGPGPGNRVTVPTSNDAESSQVSTVTRKPGPGNPPHKKTIEKTKKTTPPTPAAPVQPEPGPATDGEGDSFQEWINLFPSSKRHNIRDARTKYAETIKNIEHSILMDSTRAYLDHEQQNEGGKYIGQALAVLTDRRWEKHKPKPDPNLTQLRTLEALAQNYPPDSPERQDYEESIKAERARLVQQGYVEDGAGGLKLPELTPEQRKSRADAHRRNEYLRYA